MLGEMLGRLSRPINIQYKREQNSTKSDTIGSVIGTTTLDGILTKHNVDAKDYTKVLLGSP